MKKIILFVTICLMSLSSTQLLAGDLEEAEIFSGWLKITKDGTGIVKFKPCDKCNSILVRITASTKTYLNGTEIGLLKAMARTKPGFISLQYSPDNKEARTIGFLN
ncbi:MAG TPA: hypothetical protein ENJ87_07905 [Gammaproteobacteria bacterium]|nr:hypothetical protein [Gammaproteobacteria bacterium]